MERRKRILVAPLDWGLGHATRCIPIIHELKKRNCDVIIASSGRAGMLLKHEFPLFKYFELPGYRPIYPATDNLLGKMLFQTPKFLKAIFSENKHIGEIIDKEKIDVVISDNRYGGYTSKVKSVFITHQLNILMPDKWKHGEKVLNAINRNQIEKFSECWVPAENENLFPKLINTNKISRLKFIGSLSRFQKTNTEPIYDLCIICSGPEPQREIFQNLLLKQLGKINLKTVVILGKPEAKKKLFIKDKKITTFNYLLSDEMNRVIQESELIISRSGYSTVMDLFRLGKKAVFIPTPGQTEQVYISAVLKKNRIAFATAQNEFDLKKAIEASDDFTGFANFEHDVSLLNEAIDSIL